MIKIIIAWFIADFVVAMIYLFKHFRILIILKRDYPELYEMVGGDENFSLDEDERPDSLGTLRFYSHRKYLQTDNQELIKSCEQNRFLLNLGVYTIIPLILFLLVYFFYLDNFRN